MTSGTQDRLAVREQILCGIYAQVLGVERVQPHDGFFDVGGDSVLAMQVIRRAREAGLDLSVRDLFDHQSAAQLATAATDAAGGAEASAAAPLVALSQEELQEFDEPDDFDGGTGQRSGGETSWETAL